MTKTEISLLSIVKALVNEYPYIAEECANNRNGGPCKRCRTILRAKRIIDEIESRGKD